MQFSVHDDFALDTILSIQLADLLRGSLDIRKCLVEKSCTFNQRLTDPSLQRVLVRKVVDMLLLKLAKELTFEKRTVSKSLGLLGGLLLRLFDSLLVLDDLLADCFS